MQNTYVSQFTIAFSVLSTPFRSHGNLAFQQSGGKTMLTLTISVRLAYKENIPCSISSLFRGL